MANDTGTVVALTPVVPPVKDDKLTEVKVTIIDGKELATISHLATAKMYEQVFSLQDDYDNVSQYIKDSSLDAAKLFVARECQRAISQWDNLVTKISKTTRYINTGRNEVEKALQSNPKTKGFYAVAVKATMIKNALK